MRNIYILAILIFFVSGIKAQSSDSIPKGKSFILKFNALSEDLQNQVDSLMDILRLQPELDLQKWFHSKDMSPPIDSRPFLGIVFDNYTNGDKEDKTKGITVLRVIEGGCAEKAGIIPGDIIIQIDGFPIKSTDHVISIINSRNAGEEISITYIRDNVIYEIPAILQSRIDDNVYGKIWGQSSFPLLGEDITNPLYGYAQKLKPRLGIMITDPDDSIRHMHQLKKKWNGAFIQDVEPGSPADKMGLQVNDLVTSVNGRPVRNSAELIQFIHSSKLGDAVGLTYIRNRIKKSANGELSAYDAGWQSNDMFRIFRLDNSEQNNLQKELEELRNKVKSLEEELIRKKGN